MDFQKGKRTGIGFVGVGAISGIYLENITNMFPNLYVAAMCDLVREKAERAAAKYEVGTVYDTMQQLFADPAVDIVLNLTRPYEHYGVSRAALEAGKPVYSEKPLAATLGEGRELVRLAAEKGLPLGGAPDTFLGAGLQTCRRLIDDGYIGTPVGAAAFMVCRGHEGWHPDPAFYYQHGGGPMMDMGPYYLTALTNLLGRVDSVAGRTKKSFATRTITSQPLAGTEVAVEVPTWVNGILDFESGATGTIFTTFDVHYDSQARFEVYGSEGTLVLPDPNTFGGPVRLLRPEEGEYRDIPLLYPYKVNSRALGLADMALALEKGESGFRADCSQTLHVLEIMQRLQESSEAEKTLPVESPYTRRPQFC